MELVPGCPDLENIVKGIVHGAGKDERIAVATCGPDGMMRVVRRAVVEEIRAGGTSVELFCERLGFRFQRWDGTRWGGRDLKSAIGKMGIQD